MDRDEFEQLRQHPEKRITADIRFVAKPYRKPALHCGDIRIEHPGDTGLKLDITYNPANDSINLNVTAMGEGPICRLDIRSNNHGTAGRTHKHELTTHKDIANNLPDAQAMQAVATLDLRAAFDEFCRMANIKFEGTFFDPGATGATSS